MVVGCDRNQGFNSGIRRFRGLLKFYAYRLEVFLGGGGGLERFFVAGNLLAF